MFRGLFIGIDRCASSQISWLNCAEKDAIALHALFVDNLGGESAKLLVGEDATKANIENHFSKLAECNEDDVVFISYSGHGSETHEIVTYDADPQKLDETSISLDQLTRLFSKIPAKQLIFLLDCCFSGGMGAKVLCVDALPRNIPSTAVILEKLSGVGRLIVTASSSEQPAWESQKAGHGLLTKCFIEALLGPEEIVKGDRVTLYSLLEYVTNRVTDAAKSLSKEQTPTVKFNIDKNFSWPIFSIGSTYKERFPEYKKPEVSSDLQSLSGHGFDQGIIDAWSTNIPSLNQLQIDAINQFNILSGEHLVVSAPTSSGKTMIGELASLMAIKSRKRALFLLPMKALVNDKHAHFARLYNEYGIKTIQATGDVHDDVPDLIKGQYDICLMTYEKFTSLVLGFPHILEQIGVIVIDEVQMIADKNRGANLEFILTVIKSRRKYGVEPQLIALSAVIGDTNGLERWLDARLLKREDRPVPLDEGVINSRGDFRYIKSEGDAEYNTPNFVSRIFRKNSNQDWVIPLVGKLVSEGKQVIVFREQKGEARGAANYLAESLKLDPASDIVERLPTGDPSIISQALRKSLEGGVAFHTADLERDERRIIEEAFREKDSKIRVIAATTTLAMGVNTPAEAVVVVGLTHPGQCPVPYSVAEYKNMVGRAGRLGVSERGFSYLLAVTPREESEYWDGYVLGKPEDLSSKLFNEKTDIRSLIVKILVSAGHSTNNKLISIGADVIIDFIRNSFGAYQEGIKEPGWTLSESDILESLSNLESHELISRDDDNKYRLTKLGWLAGQGIIEIESIIRLVDTVKNLRPEDINDPTLIALTQLTVELSQDHVYFPVNSRGATKELNTWSQVLADQKVPRYIMSRIQSFSPDDYSAAAQAKKAAACLLWVSPMKLIEIEDILTRHGRKYDGAAGPVRRASNRTKDMIGTVARVVELIHPEVELDERSKRIFTRLETGVPSSMLELATQMGNRLSRSDYHSLMENKLTCFEVIGDTDDDILMKCIANDGSKLQAIKTAAENYKDETEIFDVGGIIIPDYEE